VDPFLRLLQLQVVVADQKRHVRHGSPSVQGTHLARFQVRREDETVSETIVWVHFCIHGRYDHSYLPAAESVGGLEHFCRKSLGHGHALRRLLRLLTFFCWVAWRERSLGVKVLWFVLIMAGGNIAMSLYVLLQFFSLKDTDSVSQLFSRKTA
jgi:hypothetical protein